MKYEEIKGNFVLYNERKENFSFQFFEILRTIKYQI